MREVKELCKIIEVLKMIEDTLSKMTELTKGERKSTYYHRAICFDIGLKKVPNDKITEVMDELSIAKNTIERMNYILGFPINSDITSDIQTAWWNANVIRIGGTEYKEYDGGI